MKLDPVMFEAGKTKTVLHAAENDACNRRHGQVAGPDDQEDLRVFEGVRGEDFPLAGQLDAGDHVGQRRVLDQVDDFVPAAGERPPDCLGEDDGEDHLDLGEAERLGGEHLPPLDRQKRPSDVLGVVGPAAEGKTQDRGHKGAQINLDIGKAEVPDEELDDERNPPEERDIGVGGGHDGPAPVNPEHPDQNSDDEAARSPRGGSVAGSPRTP